MANISLWEVKHFDVHANFFIFVESIENVNMKEAFATWITAIVAYPVLL